MTALTDEPLKPCPFCGGSATFKSRFDVKCSGCAAEMNGLPGQVAEEWNRRASDDLLAKAVRDEAYERAAKVCEGLPQQNHIQPADRRSRMANLCAAAIRALTNPPSEG